MQNTSHAVMAQRREPHNSLDDFPTPPWATRALVEKVLLPTRNYRAIKQQVVWEPSANRGHMVRPLREYFGRVIGSDIHDYGDHKRVVRDFLFDGSAPRFIEADGIDWIITNPPFRLAQQFVERALALKPRAGVASFEPPSLRPSDAIAPFSATDRRQSSRSSPSGCRWSGGG